MPKNKLRYLAATIRILLQVEKPLNSPVIKYRGDSSVTFSDSPLIRNQFKILRRPHEFPTYSELVNTLPMLGLRVQAHWTGNMKQLSTMESP